MGLRALCLAAHAIALLDLLGIRMVVVLQLLFWQQGFVDICLLFHNFKNLLLLQFVVVKKNLFTISKLFEKLLTNFKLRKKIKFINKRKK
jgi:hypothetical protein